MSRAALEWDGDVAVIRMSHEENRFHPEMLDALNGALDEVEAKEGPAAVVFTGEGKFFSNGLDLEYMGGAGEEEAFKTLDRVHALLARVLGFPTLTVAAINGHVFAAGAMLATACDVRVMRDDRGFWCLPEVDIGLTFTPGMNALMTAKLDHVTAHEAMVTGRRYSAAEAVAAGIVHEAVGEDRVLPESLARAAALAAKPRHAVGGIKARLHAEAIALLEKGGT